MLTAETFTRFPAQMWDRVLEKVRGAAVFMDPSSVESLHWSGGGAALLGAGARSLRLLCGSTGAAAGRNEEQDDHGTRAVFVVSTMLKGRTWDAIRDVVTRSHFQHCTVFCSVQLECSSGPEQLEEALCGWMEMVEEDQLEDQPQSYSAEVLHVPLGFTSVSDQLLLLPAHAHLFPLLPPDLEAINAQRPEKKRFCSLVDVDLHSLPTELQMEIRSLALALNSLFEATGTREESFAVGPMSRIIAGELANHPQAKNRRKTAQNKASIIFLDRTMDLTGAVGHHGDNLVEKILTVLDPLPGHVTDVKVDMLELTNLQRTHSPLAPGCLAPGCLAQPPSSTARALWEAMLTSKHKEGVMEVRRQLVEAASKEKLPLKMSLGRVTPEQLGSYIQLFRSNWGALESHCGVLQLALATAQTLRHPTGPARWDACLACERLLLQALGDSDFPSVLRQLLLLVKPQREEVECGPEELLLLLVYLYSLRQGGVPEEEAEELEKVERDLIGALTLLITSETELSPMLQKLTGCVRVDQLTIQSVHSTIQDVFETLRGLSSSREHLKQLQTVYTASDGVHQATYRPFLRQLLDEVFRSDRQECPDIEHMSGGLTDLLKTGFSMFMKVTRPHPTDHPLLLLFLVGGVTPSELRLIREVVSAHKPGTQVLALSSRMLRPLDIPELLFCTQRLLPASAV